MATNIVLDEPATGTLISDPVRLRGTSTAFEPVLTAEVRQDGVRQPLGRGSVMGGSMGELGPFDGTVSFAPPTARQGAVVLTTTSIRDGTALEATVASVAFAPAD